MKKNKRIILIAIFISIMFAFGFFIGYKISWKRNVVVNASRAKQTMDKTDSKVTPNKHSIQAPGEYKPWITKRNDGKKIAYLTFDDGPSDNNTPKILNILKQNNIKATFFVIGKNAEMNKELVKREIAEGNVVGNHTYSHQLNYKEGPKKFVEDLDKCDSVLKSIIGNDYKLKLIRFPGGSFNSPHLNLNPFKEEVKKAGYHYVDWNDLTADAEHSLVPVSGLVNRLKKETGDQETVVILMHDAPAKTTTVQALPLVIEYLKSKGYSFDTL